MCSENSTESFTVICDVAEVKSSFWVSRTRSRDDLA